MIYLKEIKTISDYLSFKDTPMSQYQMLPLEVNYFQVVASSL